jgi:AcrR family transcriptional regulator
MMIMRMRGTRATSDGAADERGRTDGPAAAPDQGQLAPSSWVDAARAAFIKGGIAAVKVDRLARELGVTRGSFYWHFRDRAHLLDRLLEDWRQRNTEPFERVAHRTSVPGRERFMQVVDLWISERDFDPAYDAAVRDWARVSRKVEAAVRATDDARIKLLEEIFQAMGHVGDEALVRARVAYFHQVGYYTLAMRETRKRRRALVPLYVQILAGFDPGLTD